MTSPEVGTARYLFAVARGLDGQALADVPGLSGHSVEVLPCADLQAVVCTVDLAEYGESELARNLEDLAWLEVVARAHNEVVFAAASTGTVAPMRLVTICDDDASVRRRIDSLHDQLVAALDRVQGRREWSVKAYAQPQMEDGGNSVDLPTGQAGAGAAYLQRKKQLAARRRAADTEFAELGDTIHHELSAAAVAARRLPAQDPRLTGRRDAMLLNGAYLVGMDEGPGFREFVGRLADTRREVTLEVEGPWPPYSFATLE